MREPHYRATTLRRRRNMLLAGSLVALVAICGLVFWLVLPASKSTGGANTSTSGRSRPSANGPLAIVEQTEIEQSGRATAAASGGLPADPAGNGGATCQSLSIAIAGDRETATDDANDHLVTQAE